MKQFMFIAGIEMIVGVFSPAGELFWEAERVRKMLKIKSKDYFHRKYAVHRVDKRFPPLSERHVSHADLLKLLAKPDRQRKPFPFTCLTDPRLRVEVDESRSILKPCPPGRGQNFRMWIRRRGPSEPDSTAPHSPARIPKELVPIRFPSFGPEEPIKPDSPAYSPASPPPPPPPCFYIPHSPDYPPSPVDMPEEEPMKYPPPEEPSPPAYPPPASREESNSSPSPVPSSSSSSLPDFSAYIHQSLEHADPEPMDPEPSEHPEPSDPEHFDRSEGFNLWVDAVPPTKIYFFHGGRALCFTSRDPS